MPVSIKKDPKTGKKYLSVSRKGYALLMDPLVNKGTAFTDDERREFNLHGLLPPVVSGIERQLARTYETFQSHSTPLEKYIYLIGLQDRNRTLFYRLLQEHIEEMMPIVYTPTVGEACQKYSHIYRKPRGLFINCYQRDFVDQVLENSPYSDVALIVATDGERILGLGDQGAGGMGIAIGKLCLYTLCAGLPPFRTLPIYLDVGTDNPERLDDPLYLGLRQHRIRGEEYQKFIDHFVAAVKKKFPNALLQWEDFWKSNAIKQLDRFKDQLCTFNDDIQGTAAVTLAGIFSALRVTKKPLIHQKIVIAGAGASAQGIADLCSSALVQEGLDPKEAKELIWTVDSRGLVTTRRSPLESFKVQYARGEEELAHYQCVNPDKISLEEVIDNVKPTILLGNSGKPALFTESIVRKMASYHERPIIFPLSNPTSKSECRAEDAIHWSEGRALIATGSPFAPIEYNNTRHVIGQCNNAYIFPGIGLGVLAAKIRRITHGMFLAAAKALAQKVSDQQLSLGALFPPLSQIRDCSHTVACAVIRQAVAEGHAEEVALRDLENKVTDSMWEPEYLPMRYEPKNV